MLDDQLTSKEDHAVVCEYGRGKSVLLDELDSSEIEYVLVDSNKEEAIDLSNRDYQVIDGDPTELATLERASVETASFVVTDARERNASIALTVRQLTTDARVICLIETPARGSALKRIGVDRVVCSPGAHRAATGPEGHDIGPRGVGRRPRRGSGRQGADRPQRRTPRRSSGRRDGRRERGRTDDRRRLDRRRATTPTRAERSPDRELSARGGRLDRVVRRDPRRDRRRRVLAPSHVGRGRRLRRGRPRGRFELASEASVTTVDDRETVGADIAGDVSEIATLTEAGIADATALVITVDDDETALLATAVGRALSDGIEILVRVTDAENVPKASDAGADYALSEQRTTARMLTTEIRGGEALHPTGYVQFARIEGARFAGGTLGRANGRSGHGWVGVERNGASHTDDTTEIAPDDTLIVAGTDDRIRDLE